MLAMIIKYFHKTLNSQFQGIDSALPYFLPNHSHNGHANNACDSGENNASNEQQQSSKGCNARRCCLAVALVIFCVASVAATSCILCLRLLREQVCSVYDNTCLHYVEVGKLRKLKEGNTCRSTCRRKPSLPWQPSTGTG